MDSASPSMATATSCWRAKRREPEATGGLGRARLNEIHESYVAKRQQESAGLTGETTLMRQAALGATTVIVLLVQDKADPNCVDSRGRTPLMYAAASGREASALALLRDCHADMSLKDNDGYDALLHAAMGGHTATVVQLVTFTKTEKKGSLAGLIHAKAHARRLVQRYAGIHGSLSGQAEGDEKPPCSKSASDIFTDLDSSLKVEGEQGEWGGGV